MDEQKREDKPEAPEEIEEVREEEPEETQKENTSSKLQHFRLWYKEHKKLSIPLSVLALVLLLIIVPFTRYPLAGLAIKKDFNVQVVDATTKSPVSGATVSSESVNGQTDGSGKAKLHLKAGKHQVLVTKKYYADQRANILVPILAQKKASEVTAQATGRQVNIVVKNLISKKPLPEANIKVADVSAKTDKSGEALVVLPVGQASYKATLSLDGYNKADEVIVKVSETAIETNDFTLAPAGKVYFLSKLSGKIDVVKTNLDGSARETVLSGTGKEEQTGTVLLASRDWKYLALLSRRESSSPLLYLIDATNNDKVTLIDGTDDASITLIGWSGNNFVYNLTRNNLQPWQTNRQALKSFSATSKKITLLEQTTASGSSQLDYIAEQLGDVFADGNQIFFIKNWYGGFSAEAKDKLKTMQATFNSVAPDGTGKKAVRSFGVADNTDVIAVILEGRFEKPGSIYLKFSDGTQDKLYQYSGGQVKETTSLTADSFYSNNYPTYLLSPGGNQAFWSDPRDGKNTLFLGDQSGGNTKQLATLSDYSSYGWFSDDYLLVSKNSSELYIMPKSGPTKDVAPVKISDYHKPSAAYYGYGGL